VNTRTLSVIETRRLPGAAGLHDWVVGEPPPPVEVVDVAVGPVGVAAPPSPLLQPTLSAATSAAAAHKMRVMR
jgi:hypothetical protein